MFNYSIYSNCIFISLDGSATFNKNINLSKYGVMNFDIRLYLYLDVINQYKTKLIEMNNLYFNKLWFDFF